MGLNAGSVYTLLGGRFSPGAFKEFDAANKNSARVAAEAEAEVSAAQARGAKAQESVASAATRASRANDAAAASNRRLGQSVPLRAMELGAKHTDQAAKNVEKLGKVAAIGAGAGLLTLAAATIYAAKTAGDFEKQMRNVNSIAKLSEGDYRNLSKGVLTLAGQTAQAPKVLAEGLYQLVSSGFDAHDSLTILQSSAKAATAGLTYTATATTAVAAVLNAYRLPADQAGQVSDTLFETVNRGVLTFEELSKSIGDVLPFSAALGVSLPEVGAAVSTMTKEGINAPETMTRLRRVIQSFIKPSKDMSAAIKETGASSGEALVKQKGLQGALEAVVKTTDGSKASIAKLFPDIRALGGTLALTGRNAKSAAQDLQAFQDTGGATQKVFDEQAKGAEFAGKRLTSSFETAAIIVGNQVLPVLAEGAEQLTHALQGAVQDGSLEAFGHTVLSIFGTLGEVVGNVAPAVESIATALVQLGGAIGLGNATELTAIIAAFAAFKTVGFVGPIIASAAGAIAELGVAAATAPSIAALGADVVAMVGPLGLIAAVAAAAAAAFVLLSGHEKSEVDAAKDVAAAKQAEQAAIVGLNDAVLAQADATFGARKADEDLAKAKQHLADVASKYGKNSKQYKSALDEEKEAALRDDAAHSRLKKSQEESAKANEKAVKQSKERIKTAKELLQAELSKNIGKLGREEISPQQFRTNLIASWQKYNAAVQDAARGSAAAAISQLQLDRVLAGQKPIADNAAVSVAKLKDVWNELSKAQQNKLAQTSGPQLAEIGNLVGQLHGVPTKQTVEILVKADNAKAQITALRAVIAGVPASKVVQILASAHGAAQQVAALTAVVHGVPTRKVIQILHNAAPAKQKMSELSGAVHAVPPSKRVAITTNAGTARGEIQSVQGAVNALHGKSIFVQVQKAFTTTETTIKRAIGGKASGRHAGPGETAFVGEGGDREYVIDRVTGKGVVVDQPTLMGLGQDDYVIPLEQRYRGRAMGLFAMLAGDLEVPGYAKGRPAAKGKGHAAPRHPMPIPNAIPPLSLPVDDIEHKQQDAKSKYEKAASKVKSLEGKVHTAERTLRYASSKGTAKAKDRAKLHEVQKELAKAKQAHDYTVEKRKMQEWTRTLREAKAFQSRIKKVELEVANDRNAMQLAAGRGDFGAYSRAKKERIGDLGRLQALIQQAKAQVKTGTDYALELEGQIQQAQLDAQTTAGEEPEAPRDKAAEEEASTGMTAPERAEQKRIERDIALAALTPDLGDDKSRAQELVNFLGTVLGEVQAEPGPRGGDEGITQVAQALKTAQSNLASLSGTGTNENSDLQAQLDQANQKAELAKQGQQIAEQALQVFGGSGDIGAGGVNARGAVININTLHPGDPATLRAVGDAATAGIGLQGSRRAVRASVGP